MAIIVPGGERVRAERQMAYEVAQARDEALAASWEAMTRPVHREPMGDAFGLADFGQTRPMGRRAPVQPMTGLLDPATGAWAGEAAMLAPPEPEETPQKAPERAATAIAASPGMAGQVEEKAGYGAVRPRRMRMR